MTSPKGYKLIFHMTDIILYRLDDVNKMAEFEQFVPLGITPQNRLKLKNPLNNNE